MADFPITWENGRQSAGTDLLLAKGFVSRMENWFFIPEDESWPYKIPGRGSAGALPTSNSVKGITFLKHPTGTDQLVLLANGRLYEAAAGVTLGPWTSVADLQAIPVAFARGGTYVKSLPDGRKENLVWTGGAGERPLIRDEAGNWRYASLKPPGDVTASNVVLTKLTVPLARVIPQDGGVPATTSYGAPLPGGFAGTLANATDGDPSTSADQYTSVFEQLYARDFNFANTAGSTGTNHTLHITFGSTDSIELPVGPWRTRTYQNPTEIYLAIEVSTTGSAGTFERIFTQVAPVPQTNLQYQLPNVLWSNVVVRFLLLNRAGFQLPPALPGIITYNATTMRIFEIRAQDDSMGGVALVAPGTYYYAQSEIYTLTLADRQIEVESVPTSSIPVTIAEGENVYGIEVTLVPQANGLSDGVKHDPANGLSLHRRVYRSTKSGTYPDLGSIGEIDMTATSFLDSFTTDGETLASPALPIVYVGDGVFPLTTQAPPFIDATMVGGMVVAIPEFDRTRIRWTPPGNPEYWPVPHDFRFLPQARNDEGRGIVALGDNLLVFTRTRVLRIQDLPTCTAPTFDLGKVRIDSLSPSEGLAGSPNGYTLFHSQKGHITVAWISDSGVWMTDGSLVSEGGLGAVRLTTHKDWAGDLDKSRLVEAVLTFDPVYQMLILDAYDRDGVLRTQYLHTAPAHWVGVGDESQSAVPKESGPHTLTAVSRAIGETGGQIRHWSLPEDRDAVLLEHSADEDRGSAILSHLESGWFYLADTRGLFQVWDGALYHGDWDASSSLDLDLLVRDDRTGVIQDVALSGLPLRGSRLTRLGLVNAAGTSLKVIIRHLGKTAVPGAAKRALGPLVLDAEIIDDERPF